MKKRPLVTLCLLMLVFISLAAQAQTSVWIVRHAEKDLKNPADTDPPLSIAGQERAAELPPLLRPQRLLAVYATPYKRTMQTAQPAAYARGLTVQTYDPADPEALAADILRKHKGGAVLIVGHSNTVLELIEAFGIKRPVDNIPDDVYDYVFNVVVQGNSVQLQTSQYGKLRKAAVVKKVD